MPYFNHILQAKSGPSTKKKNDDGAPKLGIATRIGARDWVHEAAAKDDDRQYYEQEVRSVSGPRVRP